MFLRPSAAAPLASALEPRLAAPQVKSVDMETLYAQTAWPLYAKFKHAYDAFRAAIGDPDSIFNEETMPGARPPAPAPSAASPSRRLASATDRRSPVLGASSSALLAPSRPSPPPFRPLRTRRLLGHPSSSPAQASTPT